jgi:tetratricopeptide (TPR) repeat protein
MSKIPPDRLAAAFAEAAGRGDWLAALSLAADLEKALPGNAGIVYNKALVLRELGSTQERIACLERALQLDRSHVNARFELASALMDKGDLKDAAGLFSEYVEAVPDDADARLNLGNCLTRLGRHDEALQHLEKAHATAPSDRTVAGLAAALRDAGDLDACERLLKTLPATKEAAALRLKILTQGARGRFGLSVDQPRLAR